MGSGDKSQLMTVGELAGRVGVTVRTVQYYDQKGLLHPSGTGPSNQRLYSEADEAELHHILVLKYLGLSLSDISAVMDRTSDRAVLRQVAEESRRKLDDELMRLFERLSTLREISGMMAERPDEPVDWMQLSAVIDRSQKDKEEFWQQLAAEGVSEHAGLNREAVLAWHALMGDTIEAMQGGVDPAGEQAMELGRRFAAMGGMEVAMAGLMHHGGSQHKGRDFYSLLQDRTLGFLQQVADRASADVGDARA